MLFTASSIIDAMPPKNVLVIVADRPRTGREADLLALTRDHVPDLRRMGFASERPALAMHNKDGVILEVFEWLDGAVARAHGDPGIQAMWAKYAAVCDYVPLADLPEVQDLFAQFVPIEL